MSGSAAIELDRVTKRYVTAAGAVHAVDDVSLAVRAGTSLAITGPSGCGKSTLLGMVGGLDTPTDGRVVLGGREISKLDAWERDRLRRHEIGFVFQSDNLLPFLTAAENVNLQRSLSGAADDGWGLELLDRMGLTEEAGLFPDQMSGGQRQRVAVARALIHRPNLVVADEPTGSLDVGNAMAVVELLLAAQRDAGATLVLVTHEPAVARRLDRTVAMRDGRLIDPMGPVDGDAGSPTRPPFSA